MRGLLSALLSVGETLIDSTRSEAEIGRYLQRCSNTLGARLVEGAPGTQDWMPYAHQAQCLLAELGIIDRGQSPGPLDRTKILPSYREAIAWRDGMAGNQLISRLGVPAGTAAMLTSLLEYEGSAVGEYVTGFVERMMRHVELRRKQAFPPQAEIDLPWRDKHQTAILLARAAFILEDMRYLNAALKLNDYAFPAHRHFKIEARHIQYVCALAEQELVLQKQGKS